MKNELPIGIQITKLDEARTQKLQEYINEINDMDRFWAEAKTENGRGRGGIRTSDILGLTAFKQHHPKLTEVDQYIFSIFDENVKKYQEAFDINGLADSGYDLLRYSEGEEYKIHCDQLIAHPGSDRVVSGLIYVNDDYSGGEIEFDRFNLKIKPEAGTVLLFPSNFIYTHQSHPVSAGVKFAVVVFFRRTS